MKRRRSYFRKKTLETWKVFTMQEGEPYFLGSVIANSAENAKKLAKRKFRDPNLWVESQKKQ